MKPHYVLTMGSEDLGELDVVDADWPWELCRFRPFAAFAGYQSLFEEACADFAVDSSAELQARAEEARNRVDTLGLGLRRMRDGRTTKEFLIRIRGDKAEVKIYPGAY